MWLARAEFGNFSKRNPGKDVLVLTYLKIRRLTHCSFFALHHCVSEASRSFRRMLPCFHRVSPLRNSASRGRNEGSRCTTCGLIRITTLCLGRSLICMLTAIFSCWRPKGKSPTSTSLLGQTARDTASRLMLHPIIETVKPFSLPWMGELISKSLLEMSCARPVHPSTGEPVLQAAAQVTQDEQSEEGLGEVTPRQREGLWAALAGYAKVAQILQCASSCRHSEAAYSESPWHRSSAAEECITRYVDPT
jgi:hypothetical protein